jgi:hypothetical protein
LAPVFSLPSATEAKIGRVLALRSGPHLAALLRVDAADHLGAVIGQRLFGVEGAGLAGQALHDGVLVDEMDIGVEACRREWTSNFGNGVPFEEAGRIAPRSLKMKPCLRLRQFRPLRRM